ncbi:unnamed protein product [Ranitomeya imitator]|uniref:Ammonium transporter AmtB-like domain-containing protein n=1 Tax=Ranitomeya imitator TaxID=111125 RepID=A0ABN9LP37_9NEOB|nr:unnamed protein product [Ranitomeya imitator]
MVDSPGESHYCPNATKYLIYNIQNSTETSLNNFGTSLINADFCVGSVCIAFGGVLGKVSPVQVMFMTLFQVTLFAVNEYILLDKLHVIDAGGSMTIHTFGAYFGLTVAWILKRPKLNQNNKNEGSEYVSDIFAMIDLGCEFQMVIEHGRDPAGHKMLETDQSNANNKIRWQLRDQHLPVAFHQPLPDSSYICGNSLFLSTPSIRIHILAAAKERTFTDGGAGTLFLWMFWPSFNSAISHHGDAQHRAAINTYCSLAASVLTTVAISSVVNKKGKIDMVHIQNATLAGGVAVGTAAEMFLTPYGSLIVGFICGIVSTLGYVYLMPFLSSKLCLHDTCGIHNLHGMPGIIGGIVGAITAASATAKVYTEEGLIEMFGFTGEYASRTPSIQGGYQAAGIAVSLAFAFVGGTVVGLFLKLPFWGEPSDENCFDDVVYWEVPGEEEEDLDIAKHYVTHIPEQLREINGN